MPDKNETSNVDESSSARPSSHSEDPRAAQDFQDNEVSDAARDFQDIEVSDEALAALSYAEAVFTAWHPMFVALLEHYVQSGYRIIPEFQLSRWPLRADVVIIRLEGVPIGQPRRIRSILSHLSKVTVVQFKGPTDDVEASDAALEVAYAYLYKARYGTPREDLGLILVADHLTPRYLAAYAELGGVREDLEPGVWQGQVAGLTWHGVETAIASEAVTERLLYTFTKQYLKDPGAVGSLDKEALTLYIGMHQHVVQFRKERGVMSLKDNDEYEEAFRKAAWKLLETDAVFREMYLSRFPPEERIRGLGPEERIRGLAPEERIRGLGPEERIRGLAPEELEALKRLLH